GGPRPSPPSIPDRAPAPRSFYQYPAPRHRLSGRGRVRRGCFRLSIMRRVGCLASRLGRAAVMWWRLSGGAGNRDASPVGFGVHEFECLLELEGAVRSEQPCRDVDPYVELARPGRQVAMTMSVEGECAVVHRIPD